MEALLKELSDWCTALVSHLAQALAGTSNATIQLTGIVGLAAVVFGLYQLRGSGRRKPPGRRGGGAGGAWASAASSNSRPSHPPAAKLQGLPLDAPKAAAQGLPGTHQNLAQAVRSQLAGIRNVVISAPGVLLEEWTPAELQEAATLRVGAAAVASEMARCCGLYILAHVGDDVGEATVRGALEAGGLVGQGPGQVPDHRLLFCSTLEGKVSLVRQLEPGLHIDGHARTACPTHPSPKADA